MSTRQRGAALLAASAIVLAGCASTRAATTTPTPAATHGAAMTPGMVMPGGSTMAGPSPSAHALDAQPSAAAQEVCSAEIRSDIATVLAVHTVPAPTSTWVDHVYTCTYRLPMGSLTLSVTESATAATAKTYAAELRQRLGATHNVSGLTDVAFANSTGVVALVKDNDTLQVDATRLPAQFGGQGEKRADFAYEIASDVLGCWTGD